MKASLHKKSELTAKGAEYESQLHKKSELSAKGAEYESQGQAPNNVRRVAPGKRPQWP